MRRLSLFASSAIALLAVASACGSGSGEDPDAAAAPDAGIDAPTSCEGPDFRFAPPPSEAYGLKRVFADVDRLEARAVFDVATQKADASATLYFQMGDEAGNPVFDLRQQITYAELDGVPMEDPNWALRFRGFESGSLRATDARLDACTSHELYLEYELGEPLPDVQNGTAPIWKTGAVEWGLKLYDVWEGRLLEQWFPASLMNDLFDFTLEIEITNATADHTLMTNGEAEVLGANHWQITFPSYFNSMSPFAEIVPTEDLHIATREIDMPGGNPITLEVFQHVDVSAEIDSLATTLESALVEFAESDGPYLHGDRFTAYVLSNDYQSEEYEGATTTTKSPSTMRHEVYHSWHGRGVRPATFNDSWYDESWVVYVTGTPTEPLARDAAPVALSTADPWLRALPTEAYHEGAQMFLSLADVLGAETLASLMRDFVEDHALGQVTTDDLERHLYCSTLEPDVRFWFHRFVYGREGDPAPAPDDYCD